MVWETEADCMPLFLSFTNLKLHSAVPLLRSWGLGRGRVLFSHWEWYLGCEFSREISTLVEVIWQQEINDNLSCFSWQLWKIRLFGGLRLWYLLFKKLLYILYLDSGTHYANGCLFSHLTFLLKIIPKAGFIII